MRYGRRRVRHPRVLTTWRSSASAPKGISYKPKNKLPVEEYLKMQGRFAHMFKKGNEWMIEEVQKEVDKNWEELLKLCEE